MHMEHWSKDPDGKAEVLGKRPVPMPLCSSQIHMDWLWIESKSPWSKAIDLTT